MARGVAWLTLVGALVASSVGCAPETAPRGTDGAAPYNPASVTVPFVDRAAEVGLDFVHYNGRADQYHIAEIMGSGVALFDYDNDGDLDVYLVQGRWLGDEASAPPPPAAALPLRDRLYRNELIESGTLRFTDVTTESRIASAAYGMGVAAGDFDGDGWVDLYVTRLGDNLLLRNLGDGTFADVTAASGTEVGLWSASAAFVDLDRDGKHELFVTNYVNFSLTNNPTCFGATSGRDYCGPLSFKPHPDRLFRNLGGGRFEDVTAKSQIARQYGAGLGVTYADLDADGWLDLYVANDGHPNQLWINRRDGTFSDEALLSGAALNEDGLAEAGMGVDAGDFDGDGDEDLFLSHWDVETNTLYVNDGKGNFDDHSAESGLGPPSRGFTGFGTAWIDYDNDGWLDVVVVNGAVRILTQLAQTGDPFPLHQRNQLFRNLGNGRFEDRTALSGAAFEASEVSRGAAFGDVDNDGDTDVLIVNNGGPARLWINQLGQNRSWIGIRALRKDGGDDLGAWVEVTRAEGRTLGRRVRIAASYLSSNDPRVLFGLHDLTGPVNVLVRWSDGAIERWRGLETGRYATLRRGDGAVDVP